MPERENSGDLLESMAAGAEVAARAMTSGVSSSPVTEQTLKDLEASNRYWLLQHQELAALMRLNNELTQEAIKRLEAHYQAKWDEMQACISNLLLEIDSLFVQLDLQIRLTATLTDKVILVKFPPDHSTAGIPVQVHRRATEE